MRQSRAVLLPFTGDCFLLHYWLKFYKEVWRDEIDKLYILANATVTPEEMQFIVILVAKMVYDTFELPVDEERVKIMGTTPAKDHGPALVEMLQECTEDLIMLIEEDAIIFKKGQIDKCFQMIENDEADIIGSGRGCCANEVIQAADRKWETGQGPAFWPNFFFCKRADLLRTNLELGSKTWYKGDRIEQLDLTITDEVSSSDTFVWASIQLRGMGLRIKQIDQYHGSPEDIEDAVHQRNVFDRKCPWFHIGSLSGWHNMLMEDTIPAKGETVSTEFERRVQFWLTAWEDFDIKTFSLPLYASQLEELYTKYGFGVARMIDKYDLSMARIKERQRLYKQVIDDQKGN